MPHEMAKVQCKSILREYANVNRTFLTIIHQEFSPRNGPDLAAPLEQAYRACDA
jgi:hypothetical protein